MTSDVIRKKIQRARVGGARGFWKRDLNPPLSDSNLMLYRMSYSRVRVGSARLDTLKKVRTLECDGHEAFGQLLRLMPLLRDSIACRPAVMERCEETITAGIRVQGPTRFIPKKKCV